MGPGTQRRTNCLQRAEWLANGRDAPVNGRFRCGPLSRALSAARSKSPDNPFEGNDPPEAWSPWLYCSQLSGFIRARTDSLRAKLRPRCKFWASRWTQPTGGRFATGKCPRLLSNLPAGHPQTNSQMHVNLEPLASFSIQKVFYQRPIYYNQSVTKRQVKIEALPCPR